MSDYDPSRERVKAILGTYDPNSSEPEKGTRIEVRIKSYIHLQKDETEKEGPDKVAITRVAKTKKGEKPARLGWLDLEEARWLAKTLAAIPE